MRNQFVFSIGSVCCVLLLLLCCGCGFIADKDRIKIAKINDRFVTRGELFRIIREMPDDERPAIRNKGDMLRVLKGYIDDEIKRREAAEVEAGLEGQPLVAREAAKQRFFREHPEDSFADILDLESGEPLGLSDAQLIAMKEEIELRIDKVEEKMRGDAAVMRRAMERYKSGSLVISNEDYELEYNLRKADLKKLEWMEFEAFRFPTKMPVPTEAPMAVLSPEEEAANVRRRLDAGESFEALKDEYLARNPGFVVYSEIENNPTLAKFRGFWLNASGCKKGDIIGPVYLPAYQVVGQPDAQGRQRVINMPSAFMVLKVLGHRPERSLTLDESKPTLAPSILMAKAMRQLREENGVEIYEDKLPDPALFSRQYRSSEWDSM